MKIYLAGYGAMPKSQRQTLYNLFRCRLFSFYETQPGRFFYGQWQWLKIKYNGNK